MNTNKGNESDNQKTVKTAFLNTFANGVSLVIGMIMVPVISRVFLPEELGIATTFLSTRNVSVIIVTLAIYSYVNRAMIDLKNRDEKKDYIFTITLFSIFMTAIFFFLLFPFRNQLKEMLSLDSFLYYWLFASILGFALYSIADYYCIFHNKSKTVFAIVLCSGISVFVCRAGICVSNEKILGARAGTGCCLHDYFGFITCLAPFFGKTALLSESAAKDHLFHDSDYSSPALPDGAHTV